MLGQDDTNPSRQADAILIRGNLFADLDTQNWGGSGYFLQILGGPRNLTVDHNTVISDHGGGIISTEGISFGLTFTNNMVRQNAYGIIGRDHSPGNDTIAALFPASTIVRNVLADAEAGRYPAGNWFPSSADFQAQFVSYANGNYRLAPTSALRGAATDGADVGANFGSTPDGLDSATRIGPKCLYADLQNGRLFAADAAPRGRMKCMFSCDSGREHRKLTTRSDRLCI